MLVRRRPTTEKGQEIVSDLVASVETQQEEDGGYITRIPNKALDKRINALTKKWRGSAVAARIIDLEGSARINMLGVYKGNRHGELEPIEFHAVKGTIERISPSFGGHITLTTGASINFGIGRPGNASEEFNLGLELEHRADHNPDHDMVEMYTDLEYLFVRS